MADEYTFFDSGSASVILAQGRPYITTGYDDDLSLPNVDYSFRAPISLPATALGIPFTVGAVSSATDVRRETEKEFRRLADLWKAETGMLSRIDKRCMHPAYQRIIAMGKAVVPFILRDLNNTRDDWFWALTAIAGEDPASAAADDTDALIEAWLSWGRENGYDV